MPGCWLWCASVEHAALWLFNANTVGLVQDCRTWTSTGCSDVGRVMGLVTNSRGPVPKKRKCFTTHARYLFQNDIKVPHARSDSATCTAMNTRH